MSLAKADPAHQYDVGALVSKLVPEYVQLLKQLKQLGVPEVLLDAKSRLAWLTASKGQAQGRHFCPDKQIRMAVVCMC